MRNSIHCSSVHLPPSGIDCSQPFTSTEKTDSHFQPLRPAEGNPHILLYRTRDQLLMKVLLKGQETENFEFEPWTASVKNTILGKSASAEKLQQDQLILD